MALCHCDGPPHPYDPNWCINPKIDGMTNAQSRPGVTIIINVDGSTR